MNTEMASDEVTDSIAHIEMHRQEMAKETSLASACNEALRKLHELLKQEQEELQKNGPHPQHTANLMVFKAAALYDKGEPCGAESNAAKYLAAEAGFRACEQALLTHGGMGYAKEYHIERYLREAMIPRLAPVSPQLILCFIAEKVLGLPKSY